LFESITEEDKTCGDFIQDGAIAHTANYSINVLNEMFEDRLISRRLWPARSPGLNPWDNFLLGTKNKKGTLHSNNPHALDELKHNICQTTHLLDVNELQLVSDNLSRYLKFV
jgi:hypothetical protein